MSTPRVSPVAALDLAPHGHAMADLALGRGGTEVARGTWLDAADQPQAKLDVKTAQKAVDASTKLYLAVRAETLIFAAWWPDEIATTRQL